MGLETLATTTVAVSHCPWLSRPSAEWLAELVNGPLVPVAGLWGQRTRWGLQWEDGGK